MSSELTEFGQVSKNGTPTGEPATDEPHALTLTRV